MKRLIFLFGFLIISGCSIFQPESPTVIQPKVLRQAPLPSISESIYTNNFQFYCEMLVNEKGDVERAKILTHTGDALWDSLATLSLLKWKFDPAIQNGIPVKILIRRRIQVKFEEPEMMSLAEILFKNYDQADSVYKALLNNADFNELVRKYSISPTRDRNGVIGSVEIRHYAKDISRALSKLKEGDFTKPLAYGEAYVIFKRLEYNN
jgi:hypothetical protein